MSRGPGTITNCGEGAQTRSRTRRLGISQYHLRGLTPDLFWSFRSTLLTTPRSGLDSVIHGLVGSQVPKDGRPIEPSRTSTLKPVHAVQGRLLSAVISELPDSPPSHSPTAFDGLPRCLAYILIAPHSSHEHLVEGRSDLACQNVLRMSLPAATSTHSNFLLYNILPRAIPFVRKHISIGEDVCVACPTGKDLGPGVIVAALSLFFGDNGVPLCGDDRANEGDSTQMDRVGSAESTSSANNRQTCHTKTAPMDHLEQPESQPLQEHPQTSQRISHVPPPHALLDPAISLYLSKNLLTYIPILRLMAGP